MRAAMFEPRPETRTATRLRSRTVGHRPVLSRAPRARLAANGAAARPFLDAADLVHIFLGSTLQFAQDCLGILWRDDRGHADTAIEDPRHLSRGNSAALLQKAKDCRQLPFVRTYGRVTTFWHNPRNVLEKSTAGNVSESLQTALLHKRKQAADI